MMAGRDHARLQSAYARCVAVARAHYENFPVASWLLPRDLQIHVAAIYTFARRADDIADEERGPANARIARLRAMGAALDDALSAAAAADEQSGPSEQDGQDKQGIDADPLFIALAATIRRYRLEPGLFHDLLDAFIQDTTKTRYADFAEVLDYCRRSANPVGRLMLQLFQQDDAVNLRDSDLICSSLQIINFMQDIQQDVLENDRVYLPLDEMAAAGVTIADIKGQSTAPHVVAFVQAQTRRARRMMRDGAALGQRLPGRFGLEIRAIIHGGLRVCEALLNQGADIYSRPRLGVTDKLAILAKAVLRL